jgi:hypothetical protein
MLIVAASVLSGIEATTSAVTGVASSLIGIFVPKDRPAVVQFALVASSAYRETSEGFAASAMDPLTTYSMDSNPPPYLIRKPIFQVSIENRADAEILVTDVAYHVDKIDQVAGGEPGPLSAAFTYVHGLEFRTGVQKRQLVPPFKIPAKSVGAFKLVLETKHPDVGLCWLMYAEFITTKGSAKTRDFQLVLSGDPEWARGL